MLGRGRSHPGELGARFVWVIHTCGPGPPGERTAKRKRRGGLKTWNLFSLTVGWKFLVHVSEWFNFDFVYIAQGIVPFMTSGQIWNFGMLSGSNQFGKRYPLKSNIDIDTQDSYV